MNQSSRIEAAALKLRRSWAVKSLFFILPGYELKNKYLILPSLAASGQSELFEVQNKFEGWAKAILCRIRCVEWELEKW